MGLALDSTGISLTSVTLTVVVTVGESKNPSLTTKPIDRDVPGVSELLLNCTARNAVCHSAWVAPEVEVKVSVRVPVSNAEALISPKPVSPAGKLSVSPLT